MVQRVLEGKTLRKNRKRGKILQNGTVRYFSAEQIVYVQHCITKLNVSIQYCITEQNLNSRQTVPKRKRPRIINAR